MAGHSKWANIKHRKGAADAKRAKVFTRLTKELIISAKLGGSDENSNPRLRSAVIKAKAANMPKDNIDRAVKKGAGELEGVSYDEIVYEGYAPHGVAIMVEVMTDKKTRTLPEIKNIFSKAGGSMAESGAVSYLFEHKGIIVIEGENLSEEKVLEMALEAGAEDIETEEDVIIVKTPMEDFHAVLSSIEPAAEKEGYTISESGLKYVAQAEIPLDLSQAGTVLKLLNTLEDHDDVQNVYSNLEYTDEILALEV